MAHRRLLAGEPPGEFSAHACGHRDVSSGNLQKSVTFTLKQINVTAAAYFALFDELSLGGQINGTVDHLPDPHHGVGVAGRRQHGLERAGEL